MIPKITFYTVLFGEVYMLIPGGYDIHACTGYSKCAVGLLEVKTMILNKCETIAMYCLLLAI